MGQRVTERSLPEAEATTVARAESRLGLRFGDPLLLLQALTHRSYLNEPTGLVTPANERLEFLGDSALGFLVARFVFERHPDLSEGDLTARRAALIRTATLAQWAREIDLAAVLRLGQGEAVGGAVRDSILADGFEAVLAAILLDQGLAAVDAYLRPFLERQDEATAAGWAEQNYKGRLQEVVQEREHLTPFYRVVAVEGPDHDSVFTVEVVVGQRVLGQGVGRSKQAAQQAAARQALASYPVDAEEGE
jgi:ribonuclease-3